MKDRRSFFKSLALIAGATSVSPMIFLPKFEAVKWKVDTEWYRFNDSGNKVKWEGNLPYEIKRIEGVRYSFDGREWTEEVRFIDTMDSIVLRINPKIVVDRIAV